MRGFLPRHVMCALMLAAGCSATAADEERWALGARHSVLASNAPPANDLPGWGLTLRRQLAGDWTLGLGLDRYEFDYEEPYKVLGLERPAGIEPIDGLNESSVISAWIEKGFGRSERWRGFWTAGLGYAFLTVDPVRGPLTGGGQFDIVTDARDEVQLLASLGVRYRLRPRWSLEAALLAQHHFTDYQVRDVVSGRTATIGSQTAPGLSLGFIAHF